MNRKLLLSLVGALLAAAPLAGSARAAPAAPVQIPPTPDADVPKGDLAPHVDCLTCGLRSYASAANAARDKAGNPLVWCARCKRDTSHSTSVDLDPGLRSGGEGKGSTGNLKLGRRSKPAPAPPAPGEVGEPAPQTPGAPGAPGSLGAEPARGAPAAVFAEVRKLASSESSLAERAVESLVAMGESGFAAARAELAASEVPVLVVAARVLVRSSKPADIELVQARLRSKLPGSAGALMLDALVQADPVHGNPRFLGEMLGSPHGGVRGAAARHLRAQLTPELLPVLEEALASKRSETRHEAVGLIGDLGVPRAAEILLGALPDPSPRVATRVISELAGRSDPGIDTRLLADGFRERWILRSSAYALLALVEREDVALQAILDDTHIEPLLAGVGSKDPFVSGVCAAALAGIGFRSKHTRQTSWLDQEVVDHLVSTVSGRVYHDDFTALYGPALRRLRLLSGQDLSTEGARWVDWWVSARAGFRAHRAWIECDPAEIETLELVWRAEGGTPLVLRGSASATQPVPAGAEVYLLTAGEARDLALVLEREGVFGPERLPGARGTRGRGEQSLSVTVAGRGKLFLRGSDAGEPWFERIASAARALALRNRWQQFPTPLVHASSTDLWREQQAWWSAQTDARTRDLALKKLLLAVLTARRSALRERALDELQALYAAGQVAAPEDFAVLTRLLAELSTWGPRARALVQMALQAGQSADPAGQLAPELARALVRSLAERFGEEAREDLERIAEAAGPAFARELTRDTRGLLRSVGAHTLASLADPEAGATLFALLSDKDPEVEAAAVTGLGQLRHEAARTELLVRARLALPPVRRAALRAVGELRGAYVLDALLLGLADADGTVRLAAVEGLAALEDPSTAPFLMALVSEGPASPAYAAARAGIARLGARAWPELTRALRAPSGTAKLEAAFLLAEQGAAEAAPALIGALVGNPRDPHLLNELVLLTCVDLRAEADPAGAWWTWWDGVVHDDGLAWFRAALERLALDVPPAEALAGKGTSAGRVFLVELLAREEAWVAERARRELGRMLGRDLGPLPPSGAARTAWIERVAVQVRSERDP